MGIREDEDLGRLEESGPELTCPNCEKAKVETWCMYDWSCQTCRARHISTTPDYWRSRKDGSLTKQYRDLLARCGVTHDMVKVWNVSHDEVKEQA